VYLIRCHGLQLDQILDGFPTSLKEFPCCYLGLPLDLRKLRRNDFLPFTKKVGAKLPRWKGKLMSKAARVQLMKSVLSAVVTYYVTVFGLPKWLIKKIDKLRRNFFLEGREHVRDTRVVLA
jgi:hypothetical protein